ncbi:hypothetical protein ABLO27_17585 [Roseibium sp. SCPC15]|jgi:hypothetical protein|uniref:hypothetical protein n=1 Tax=Roseibium sp. SCP15 TaxID=3141376 RepID=UPI003335A630
MANFDDITGWREELEAFEATEEGRNFFGKYGWRNATTLTFEQEVRFAEELFRHDEIHEALKKSAKWVKFLDENPDFGRDDENFSILCPWEANKTTAAFERWYAMKTGIPYGPSTFTAGFGLAVDVANGDLASLHSPETKAHAKAEYGSFLRFPEEEV